MPAGQRLRACELSRRLPASWCGSACSGRSRARMRSSRRCFAPSSRLACPGSSCASTRRRAGRPRSARPSAWRGPISALGAPTALPSGGARGHARRGRDRRDRAARARRHSSPERLLVGRARARSSLRCRWCGSAWRRSGDLGTARDALARRAGVVGERSRVGRSGSPTLGVAAQVVPHPALALPRLAAAADMPAVVERLRAASALPPDDYVALDDDVTADVPDGARLPAVGPPPRWTPLERAAAIAQVGGVRRRVAHRVRDRRRVRPAVGVDRRRPRTRRRSRSASAARSIGAAIDRARARHPAEAAIAEQLAELDAALDELAKLLDASVPADGRTERVLRVRLREEERAAAQREQELADYNVALNNEIVVGRPAVTRRCGARSTTAIATTTGTGLRADRAEADDRQALATCTRIASRCA